ncbi:hypothetical protein VDGL01_08104 [Verticillium dahliae]
MPCGTNHALAFTKRGANRAAKANPAHHGNPISQLTPHFLLHQPSALRPPLSVPPSNSIIHPSIYIAKDQQLCIQHLVQDSSFDGPFDDSHHAPPLATDVWARALSVPLKRLSALQLPFRVPRRSIRVQPKPHLNSPPTLQAQGPLHTGHARKRVPSHASLPRPTPCSPLGIVGWMTF